MKKLIIGNFKMNPPTFKQAELLFKEAKKTASKLRSVDVVLCVPAPYLAGLSKFKGMLGAQNLFYEMEGAFTGGISALALKDVGVSYVIVGHSELRALGDTNEIVSKKIKAALKAHLRPILCVGEKERDEKGLFWHDLKDQIKNSLAGMQKAWVKEIVVAYEPIWALSSTKNHHDVTSQEVHEAVIFIKKVLADLFGRAESEKIRIIYGGSANSKNTEDILTHGNVVGLLPGKASLNAKEFSAMLKIADHI